MAVDTARPQGLTTTLDRAGVRFSWLAIAAVVPFAPVLGDLPLLVRYAPFLVSVVAFGLPHGAVDHLVPARLAGIPLLQSVLGVGVLYAAVGGLYLVLWFVSPAVAFVGFVLLTWFHWGQGDVYALLVFAEAEHLSSRIGRGLTLAVRGGLPMLVPLVSHPVEYRRVAVALVSLFNASAAPTLDPLFATVVRTSAGVGFAATTLAAIVLGGWRVRRGAARRGWVIDVGETVLLWLYFLVVPPVVGIGLYFCFWHSTRHIARLALVDDQSRSALTVGDVPGALRRFARDAAPMTLGALAVVGGLAFIVPSLAGGLRTLLALYLVGIAVLTLPHVVIVSWMDYYQGVW